ncbi:MAG: saccharopine dehydrogenase family protein, partial [Longimicrobiales bacterium]
AANVMIMPGAGFDVVPTDCLAAYLKNRLPAATSLALAIRGTGKLSRGTRTTMVEHQHRGGMIRRGGSITRVPAGWKTRSIDFGDGQALPSITIPWGDVATAYYSTGIPNIEVFAALPDAMRRSLRLSRYFGWLTGLPMVKAMLRKRVRAGAPGPNEKQRARSRSFVWGEVTDGQGNTVVARLSGPDGYTMTAHTALLITRRVLQGDAPHGFQTPSRAYGPELVLEVPGVIRSG